MITITNKNIYHTDFSLSDYLLLDEIEPINMSSIVNYLGETIELGESVTLKRLFEIVSYNLEYFNEIYFSVLGGYRLEPFLQEIQNNKTEDIKTDYLELYWFCECYDGELNISLSLHGKEYNDKEDISYALDFVSLNNIKDCIIKIDGGVTLTTYLEAKKTHDVKYLGEKTFTLFELFCAIFYEITFHGGPQDKKEKFVDIEKTIEELDMDNIEGSTISFDDMMEQFDAKDIYLVKYNELRDRIEKDRLENEDNLEDLKKCLQEKLKIYDEIEKSESDNELYKYYKKITNIEYSMQLLYAEEEDISFHRFWLTPKCICPKIDNAEIYPSKNPIFDKDCPIHKKVS